MDCHRPFREWLDHSRRGSSDGGCICAFLRPVGRAFLAQHFALAAHLVGGIVMMDTLIADQADAQNPARASRLAIDCHWRGVFDPYRSVKLRLLFGTVRGTLPS